MKKILTFIVSLFFLFCLTGCLTSSDVLKPVEQNGEGTLGDYYVKVIDHFVTETAISKDILVLSFDFTNNSTTGISAASALNLTLFQSGIELSPAFLLIPLSGYSSTNYYTKVKDGATLNCQVAYDLRSVTDPVEVEVMQSFSFSMEKITAELDIAGQSQPDL